ncbi:HNH endonuclease [Vibrio phage vB_VviC_ZQ26]|nr:HNH endonuclease [Vibrio phage vB_VviC_ZQ26]
MAKVSQEKLQSYILASTQIEFINGKPFWSVPKSGAKKGQPAGSVDKVGYRRICVNGDMLLAHRVSWFISNGYNPDLSIDHIDGDKDNNDPSNLRVVEFHQNQKNMKKPITNSTGYKGVYKNSGRGKPFCAQVKHKGAKHYLGRFETAEDAKAAYDEKAKELHGDYYRYE